jgi:hypothetical protein
MPTHEKLPWPGLRAKDYLTRVVTQALKEAKEQRERIAWAEKHIALVLDHISPQIAVQLIFRETHARHVDLGDAIEKIKNFYYLQFGETASNLRQTLDTPIPPKRRV